MLACIALSFQHRYSYCCSIRYLRDVTMRSPRGAVISNVAFRSTSLVAQLRLDERDDFVRLGVPPQHRLREHERSVDVHVEDPVRAGDDLDGREVVLMVFEQPSHQTGGVLLRASGDAVLDTDAVELRHSVILTAAAPGVSHWEALWRRDSVSSPRTGDVLPGHARQPATEASGAGPRQ